MHVRHRRSGEAFSGALGGIEHQPRNLRRNGPRRGRLETELHRLADAAARLRLQLMHAINHLRESDCFRRQCGDRPLFRSWRARAHRARVNCDAAVRIDAQHDVAVLGAIDCATTSGHHGA